MAWWWASCVYIPAGQRYMNFECILSQSDLVISNDGECWGYTRAGDLRDGHGVPILEKRCLYKLVALVAATPAGAAPLLRGTSSSHLSATSRTSITVLQQLHNGERGRGRRARRGGAR